MPLYEYQCDGCGIRFEVIQKFSEAPVETCKACGARVQRLVSAPAIQFKGTGWYITDYARKGASGSNGGSTGSGDTASPPSSTTDKPAASGSAPSAPATSPSPTDKK